MVNHDGYYHWLTKFVGGEFDYSKLLTTLFKKEFSYFLVMDGNRAEDGLDLRGRYEYESGYSRGFLTKYYGDGSCSILEMMVALSIRCENAIMSDDFYGDRTSLWFWNMVDSLGLSKMVDTNFDAEAVNYILDQFIYRQYDRNGHGGLFTINNCPIDLRTVEIWMQMNWYLNSYS